MGILSKLVGGAATQPIEAVGNILTGLFGDKGEKLDHEQVMARLAMSPALAQVELNKIEAQHRSIFVAGWRPFIGWVCGMALAYTYLGHPIISIWVAEMPTLETVGLYNLVLALLGLGTLRTTEKLKGKAK